MITTDDGSAGSRGLVTGPAAALLAERGAEHVYACGPMPMLAALAALAAQMTRPLSARSKRRWPAGSACA